MFLEFNVQYDWDVDDKTRVEIQALFNRTFCLIGREQSRDPTTGVILRHWLSR